MTPVTKVFLAAHPLYLFPQNMGYAPDFVQGVGMLVKQIKAKGEHTWTGVGG